MTNSFRPILLISFLACVASFTSGCSDQGAEAGDPSNSGDAATPTAMETLNAMVADCEACAEERAARHAATPLYTRLGGHEKITAFVAKLIEVHQQNEVVSPYMEGVDLERLSTNLVNFIGSGTGGPEVYEGRSVLDSHAGMGVTPEVFLAAGGDIGVAMEAVGWGADEQQEFMCILLSMMDDVLVKADDE
jgi:hemoglobin